MSSRSSDQKANDAFTQELIDSVFSMSDEEILAETLEEFGDIQRSVEHVKNIYKRSNEKVGRYRLATARAAINTGSNTGNQHTSQVIDIKKTRQILEKITHNENALPGEFTLAARNLDELTDEDIASIYQDLIDLGVIPSKDDK